MASNERWLQRSGCRKVAAGGVAVLLASCGIATCISLPDEPTPISTPTPVTVPGPGESVIFSMPPTPNTFAPTQTTEGYYTITTGDTLSSIAARFGTTVDKLAQLNGFANPNLIYAGSQIKVTGNESESILAELMTLQESDEQCFLVGPGEGVAGVMEEHEIAFDEHMVYVRPPEGSGRVVQEYVAAALAADGAHVTVYEGDKVCGQTMQGSN